MKKNILVALVLLLFNSCTKENNQITNEDLDQIDYELTLSKIQNNYNSFESLVISRFDEQLGEKLLDLKD